MWERLTGVTFAWWNGYCFYAHHGFRRTQPEMYSRNTAKCGASHNDICREDHSLLYNGSSAEQGGANILHTSTAVCGASTSLFSSSATPSDRGLPLGYSVVSAALPRESLMNRQRSLCCQERQETLLSPHTPPPPGQIFINFPISFPRRTVRWRTA